MTHESYLPLIWRLAPNEDPAHVEAWICHEHGAVDNVNPIHFAREIKRAVTSIHGHDLAQSDKLARRYGLQPRHAGSA